MNNRFMFGRPDSALQPVCPFPLKLNPVPIHTDLVFCLCYHPNSCLLFWKMNFLRVSFTAATHKTFRHMLRSSSVSSNVNMMIRGFATAAGNLESEKVVENRRGDFVTSNNTLMMNDMSKAEEELSRAVVEVLDGTRRGAKGLSPNETKSLIHSLCKNYRFDDARRVLKEMFDNGFSPSMMAPTLNDIFSEFLQIGDIRKAFEMRYKIYYSGWEEDATESLLFQGLSDEVTYTSLINAYLDEGKWDYATKLLYDVELFGSLQDSVLYSVIINGLDNNKARRTTEIKKHLLRFNYGICFDRPIFEYHSTMVENSSDDDDEFKSLVDLVEGICIKGLENVFDIMLKLNYKPDGIDDGIVYNLFIFAHCKHFNIDEAYIMYKEMEHYGFACHMFTVLALIRTLERENMVNELLWVIQNVLRSCNLNDSEIVKFLNEEFNPMKPVTDSEALFDVLAEKAKDGLFLKC